MLLLGKNTKQTTNRTRQAENKQLERRTEPASRGAVVAPLSRVVALAPAPCSRGEVARGVDFNVELYKRTASKAACLCLGGGWLILGSSTAEEHPGGAADPRSNCPVVWSDLHP